MYASISSSMPMPSRLTTAQRALDELEQRWLELAELQQG
jgi:hypothetical protein